MAGTYVDILRKIFQLNKPPNFYNFTSDDLLTDNVTLSNKGTRVKMLDYNETVEITFQGTNVMNSG